MASRYNDLVSRYYELASRYNELVARYYESVSRYYELVSRYNELISRYFEDLFFLKIFENVPVGFRTFPSFFFDDAKNSHLEVQYLNVDVYLLY